MTNGDPSVCFERVFAKTKYMQHIAAITGGKR